MSILGNQYLNPLAPSMGSIYNIASTTTAARKEVPPDWRAGEEGQLVTITCRTDDVVIKFGDGGVMVDFGAVASTTGETLAPAEDSGFLILAGQSVTYRVQPWHTHFAYDFSAATANGGLSMFRSSGKNTFSRGEGLPQGLSDPELWVDFTDYTTLTVSSGIAAVRNKGNLGGSFSESTNKPAQTDAVNAQGTRCSAAFTAASSHKLVSTDAPICAMFDGTDSFTLMIACYRSATAALHTLFSVGRSASDDGRWDITADASDDFVITRRDTAAASTTSTYATTLSASMYLFTVTFDGTTPLYYQNRTNQTLSGTAAGDVGTAGKVALGCRAYNASTYNQFWAGQIHEVVAFNRKLNAEELDRLHAWAKRRYAL